MALEVSVNRLSVLTVLCLSATAAAFAEEPPVNATSKAAAEGVVLRSATPAIGAAFQTPPRPVGRSRRPSMVGYVDDSTIESSVRVRYDLGFDVGAPDRAEFFYGKCGCYRGLPTDHPAYDPDAAGPGPGILTSLDFRQFNVTGQFGILNDNASLFFDLPIRTISPQSFVPDTGTFGGSTGIGDIRIGAKASVFRRESTQVTVQAQASLPSGDSLKGLGTDHGTFEPSLLYHEQVSDRLGVEAEFGEVFAIGGSAGIPTAGPDKFSGNVLYYGIGPNFVVYETPRATFAPVLELVGWHVLSGFQTLTLGPADGVNIVNLKIGGRVGLSNGSSIYVGYGKALTDAKWYDDIVRFEYRMGF